MPTVRRGVRQKKNRDARSSLLRWRADAAYRPPNLIAWAKEKGVDPAKFNGAVRVTDPNIGVP
jgi:hypothetical protein